MSVMTKSTLEKIAENCNRQAPVAGWTYSIEYAYGQPRLVLLDSRMCCRDVSPRLSRGQLADWMWAYLKGIEAGKEAVKVQEADDLLEACKLICKAVSDCLPPSGEGELDPLYYKSKLLAIDAAAANCSVAILKAEGRQP